MRSVNPDFVSVTYGAGGSTRQRTMDVCGILETMNFTPVMPHLTCVGSSRSELEEIVDEYYKAGFRNIMCLRGDPPCGETAFKPHPDGLAHAVDLVELVLARHPDICCGVACYPEKHPEAVSTEEDILHLKAKLDAGALFATTQLFFDNQHFIRFAERCRAAGITKPIIPGLMPALSTRQIARMVELSSAELPPQLTDTMHAAGDSGPEAEAVGMKWTIRQINELVKYGVPGIHLYILNRASTATTPALTECLAHWRQH
jgi:methylenetetrahydrofolate reductase (NADPH)